MVKEKKYNKVKSIKKASRENQGQYGKGGVHQTEKDKPRQNKNTRDYLDEIDE